MVPTSEVIVLSCWSETKLSSYRPWAPPFRVAIRWIATSPTSAATIVRDATMIRIFVFSDRSAIHRRTGFSLTGAAGLAADISNDLMTRGQGSGYAPRDHYRSLFGCREVISRRFSSHG